MTSKIGYVVFLSCGSACTLITCMTSYVRVLKCAARKKYVNVVFSSSCAVNNHIIPTEKSITAIILLILLRKITVMCVACNLSSTFYKTDNMFN